ncbi:Predicted dithiol-disulfide isomerase, DsbA family [Pelagirhabdus alkalitolerans]|uniref:ClpXP adapter protein SpxH n=1 Tax=Pelagirhabdus alkalitolerans TaxID=1612202 RepID=A0A1G6KDD3_9BACI|nr:ClpXP adapter SpxH family protein [Pelagirhabdus alkalitolerans]SDC29089.1 Predicted dithiol-disulfide isomerase, DsbA family [Pelagirhabdus alkalitolerans]
MSFKQTGPSLQKQTNAAQYSYFDLLKKPIEIYIFIDPLCPESWSLDPIIKKLQLEYGRFFTIRPILSDKVSKLNQRKNDHPTQLKRMWEKTANRTGMCCDGDLWEEDPLTQPYHVAYAIKAAELQGIKAGRRYLRKVQEYLFLSKTDISSDQQLIQIAKETNLDLDEFKRDLHAHPAKKAFQCDLKLSKEMEVDQTPSVVFFNESIEDEGLKLSGAYDYHIYVKVLKQLLERDVQPFDKPKLEDFLSHFNFIGSHEIALIFDWSIEKACKEMKKLQLKQLVTKVPVKHGVFWRYNPRP